MKPPRMRLKDWVVGVIPVACKKPGSRLQMTMGGRVKCPAALQGKAPLFGKFPEVGFQGDLNDSFLVSVGRLISWPEK